MPATRLSHLAPARALSVLLSAGVAAYVSSAGAQTAAPVCQPAGTCTNTGTLDEYRHAPSGVRVYTLCAEEKAILSTVPALFTKTGVTFPANANGAAPAPLHRYFFRAEAPGLVSRHFYTVLDDEVALLNNTPAQGGGFTRCDEGIKGSLVKPQTNSAGSAVGGTDTLCPNASRPMWRLLESNPVQHHLTELYSDIASAPAGTVSEGVRACINDSAATVRLDVDPIPAVNVGAEATTQMRVRAVGALLGLTPDAEATFLLPSSLRFVTDSATACVETSPSTVSCKWTQFSQTRGDAMTLKLRRVSTGSPSDQVLANAWYPVLPALSGSRPQASLFDPKACTASGTPYYGCAVAPVRGVPPLSVGNPGMQLIDARLYGPSQGAGPSLLGLAAIAVRLDALDQQPTSPVSYLLSRTAATAAWQLAAAFPITLSGRDGAARFPISLPGPAGEYSVCLSSAALSSPATNCATSPFAKVFDPVPYATDTTKGKVASEVRSPNAALPDAVRGQSYPANGPFTCAWSGNVPAATPTCVASGLPAGLTFQCSLLVGAGSDDTRYACAIAGTVPTNAATGQRTFSVSSSASNDMGQATTTFTLNVR